MNEKEVQKYTMIVVQGEEGEKIDELGKYANKPITEAEYLTNLKIAQEKYPKYEIEKAPAILIFETFGVGSDFK